MMTIKSPFSVALARARERRRDENEIKRPMTYNITNRVSERSSPLRKEGPRHSHLRKQFVQRNIVWLRYDLEMRNGEYKSSLCTTRWQHFCILMNASKCSRRDVGEIEIIELKTPTYKQSNGAEARAILAGPSPQPHTPKPRFSPRPQQVLCVRLDECNHSLNIVI